MATFQMDMPPALGGTEETQAQDLNALRSYVARLVDRLLYTLNNIDSENLVEGGILPRNIAGGGAGILDAAASAIGSQNVGRATVQHLRAMVAEIVTAVIQTAVIDWAHIAALETDVARIADARIGSAHIDFSQINALSANDVVIQSGAGGKLYINDLAVTDANMVSLSTGQLLVRGTDGKWYRIAPDGHGGVTAAEVQATGANIGASAISGSHIVENSITSREINVAELFADQATIVNLISGMGTFGTLMADTAMLSYIRTAIVESEALTVQVHEIVDQDMGDAVTGLEASYAAEIQALRTGINARVTQSAYDELTASIAERFAALQLSTEGIRADVQAVEDRYGSHIILDADAMRLTQDQAGDWYAKLTATYLAFQTSDSNRAAVFGRDGAIVERLQSIKSLSVGTDGHGWIDWESLPSGVGERWRGSAAKLYVRSGPQDCMVTLGTGSHPISGSSDWDEEAEFSVDAENATAYQWQRRTMRDGKTWDTISGETGATLTHAIRAAYLSYEFRCKVTASGQTIETEPARFLIKGAPVILVDLPARTSGLTLSFSVAGAVSYQWQHRGNNSTGGGWTNDTGADNPQAPTKTFAAAAANRYIRCVVTDADGRPAATRETVVEGST